MLKPIHRAACSSALVACQNLMQRLALWLCAPGTAAANLTQAGLQPPVMPSGIEADWLWGFLQRVEAGQTLLDRALVLVAMPAAQKAALTFWVQSVSALATRFQPAPPLLLQSAPLLLAQTLAGRVPYGDEDEA